MRILLANKFYYRRGGDCIYTMNLEKLLKAKGHEVAVYAMQYPDNEPSEWSCYWPSNMTGLRAVVRPFGVPQVVRGFSRLIDDFRPDVVHLNNIHSQLSPVIAEVAHSKGVRVVWTLHDSKLVCPCYTCSRKIDGKLTWCTECFSKKTAVISHRCLHGSLAGSVIGFLEARKWNRERLERCTDVFLPPSQFMKDTCVAGGYTAEKFSVLCNFIDVAKIPPFEDMPKGDYCVYLGRVNEVKGVPTLCKAAARLGKRLIVIGGGEMLPQLKQEYAGCADIEFLGQMNWDDFMPIVRKARFMVLPAEWSENNPLTVIESQSLGTPVLGARIGGIPELIEEGVSGMTFTSGDVDDLAAKISAMWNYSFDYRAIAMNAVEQYSSEAYYDKLMRYYRGED